jgi:ATP-binding cassette subfamily B protein
VATLATAAIPLVQRQIIDDVLVSTQESIWPLAGLLVIAAAVNYGGIYLRRYFGGRLSLDVQYDLRTELFGSLSRLDGARQDEIHTGQLTGRSISDLNMVQSILSMVPMTLGNLVLFVASLAIMLALSPVLALVTLAVAPALWMIALASRRKLFPASWDAQQRSGDVAGISTRPSAGCAWSRGSARRNRSSGGWRRRARGCSPPGCG